MQQRFLWKTTTRQAQVLQFRHNFYLSRELCSANWWNSTCIDIIDFGQLHSGNGLVPNNAKLLPETNADSQKSKWFQYSHVFNQESFLRLTHGGLVSPYGDVDVLPDTTKPLPELMFSIQFWDPEASAWKQFCSVCPIYNPVQWVEWKLCLYNYCQISQRQTS